jgi:AbrB family looped-hinge helix DNA binding protein
MKAAGIITRIDDLGRLVIPKEVRRTMQIKEGDPFELYTEGDLICFKKYSTEPELKETVNHLKEILYNENVLDNLDEEKATEIKVLFKCFSDKLTNAFKEGK